jgi:hypothetical protein
MSTARPNRKWIWFFLTLAVLAITALVVLRVVLWSRQLTLAQLNEARELWDRNGPRDYDMKYVQTGSTSGTFYIRVRQGKVISVVRNGEPLEPRQHTYYGMPALFGFIEVFLKQDSEPGKPRTLTTATFDPSDGHVTRFYRRVLGTSEQIEIVVQLTPIIRDETFAGPTEG